MDNVLDPTPDFRVQWHVNFDIMNLRPGGHEQRNELLEHIQETSHDWVWFLDDDNQMLPNFVKRIRELIKAYPETRAFVFDQQRQTRKLIAQAENMRLDSVDMAQLVYRRDFLGKFRFSPVWGCDALLVTELYNARKPEDAWIFVNETLCGYNSLSKVESHDPHAWPDV
jgi:glycosyltransferase involved in cell wall biosynthesis